MTQQEKTAMQVRCPWCLDGGSMLHYHDTEWGTPVHDDRRHFEYLSLEVLQCGLNWAIVLKKRESFRQALDNFDFQKIALYTDRDLERVLSHPGIIRSERKIRAIVNNAGVFLGIIEEYVVPLTAISGTFPGANL